MPPYCVVDTRLARALCEMLVDRAVPLYCEVVEVLRLSFWVIVTPLSSTSACSAAALLLSLDDSDWRIETELLRESLCDAVTRLLLPDWATPMALLNPSLMHGHGRAQGSCLNNAYLICVAVVFITFACCALMIRVAFSSG